MVRVLPSGHCEPIHLNHFRKWLILGVSTRFGRRMLAKSLEKTRPTGCFCFQNLRLGSIKLFDDRTKGWVCLFVILCDLLAGKSQHASSHIDRFDLSVDVRYLFLVLLARKSTISKRFWKTKMQVGRVVSRYVARVKVLDLGDEPSQSYAPQTRFFDDRTKGWACPFEVLCEHW